MPQIERKKMALRMLLLTLVTLLAVMAFLPSLSRGDHRKKVLVLNSYSTGYKWTDDINQGIAAAAREAGEKVSLQIEFMGTKWAFDPEYLRLLYEAFRHKFKGARFDAIIATDNDAFEFLVKYRDALFPGTPVIFCGVNQFQASQLRGAKGFTGVNEVVDLKATVDLALKLHPKTRQIAIVNDTTTTGRAVHNRILELLPDYRGRLDFVLLEDMEMQQILAAVRRLPREALVLFTFFSRDSKGTVYDFDESVLLVSQASRVPVYGTHDFNLGYGIVGGMLASGYFQGKTAGDLAMRVLRGEEIDKIPVIMNSPNRFMFDNRQLRRFNIRISDLPPGSIVVNRPINIYNVHKSAIWGLVAALAGLMLIVLLLLRNMAIKKQAERKLRQLAQELEERVQQRTRELGKSQAVLEKKNRELQRAYLGLKAESADRIRVMEELRLKDQLLLQQSRMAAMGEMLGNIAHQWRQPLNLVGLKIQEIGLSCKLGAFSEELLNANVTKAMEILLHLSKTIDDLRTLSTPDRRKVSFKVVEVITKTLSLVGESLNDRGITVETSSVDDPQIDGYPNEYAQVLLNILMNSRDAFLERGKRDARIKVRAWIENGRAEVAISDNAGGIAEEIIGKIFDPYFTTKEPGKGTGVGLFMSKTIIEKNMGGSLTARNTGDGVEFRISV